MSAPRIVDGARRRSALLAAGRRRVGGRRRPRPGAEAADQLDRDRHVRACSSSARCSSPSGPRRKTKSAADFYTAGGGITGFQNGLAIAGDYMSAASFLGISAAVMVGGFDGLIYSIGFLVGWPVITFLLAERLRNLGKFTFADVAAFRFAQTPVRIFAASGTLVVVAFYLIAQMVGAGQLIKLLFGLEYWIAVVIVGALMMVYVLFGGMTATTWVQIIKACLLLGGATFMALHGAVELRLQPRGDVRQGGRGQDRHRRRRRQAARRSGAGRLLDHGPGRLHQGPDLGHQLRHGADVRHRRAAAHPDALLHRARTPRRRASRCSGRPPGSATSTC